MADAPPKPASYDHPTGGWGSVKGISKVELRSRAAPGALDTLRVQNKPEGYMCSSCAWVKPPNPHPFEFCENGAKATLWDLTTRRCTPEFFARHTVSELRGWGDYELEMQGRLTHPLRYDPASDTYVETSWDEAFAAIGAKLRTLAPKSVTFYAS
ncbi:MAG: FdhF/YdeP family oxidoreductase, partial [Tsuneonella sp.]